MKKPRGTSPVHIAFTTLTEIKAMVERFEDGQENLFRTLDSIVKTTHDYKTAMRSFPAGNRDRGVA